MAANDYGHLAAQAFRTVEIRQKLNPTLGARSSHQNLFAREMQKMRLPKGMQKVFLRRAYPDARLPGAVEQGFSEPHKVDCGCFNKGQTTQKRRR